MRKAALILGDNLAAIVGARSEPEVQKFHELTLAQPRPPEATVFCGGRRRTDRISAAVANAVAADWLELDEGYRVVSCHAGLYVVPALLAEAEALNAPLAEMLRALSVAYEIVARVARAWTPADAAVHSHARYSAIGAAAACCALRKVPESTWRDALSAAFTLSVAGPRNHMVRGALVRNVWPAVGAWCGMMSVHWAQCGISGLATSADDAFTDALHGTPHPDELTADLGSAWAVLDGYHKIHACCQHAHSAVEAALALRGDLMKAGGLDAVSAITVASHPHALPLVNYEPPTTLAAKFSLPHIISAALVHGDAGVAAFATSALMAKDVAALRTKVEVVPFESALPPPNDRPARVEVKLRDGGMLTQECLSARGGPDRPFTDEEILSKIATLTASAYPNFAAIVRDACELDPQRLRQGWAEVVSQFCGAA
jgi:2-methylcitrate dehydratase PrpD